jgi:hypothetical protein
VTSPDRVGKVFQFNRQESAHLAQVFDRPPGRVAPN